MDITKIKDLYNELDEIKTNLRKLSKKRRTRATLTKKLKEADETYKRIKFLIDLVAKQFKEEQLSEEISDVAKQYFSKARIIYSEIVQFCNESVESDTESETEFDMDADKFFNFASKILTTEFDGSSEKLLAFLDSLNLIKANCNGNERNAVCYVRTKLSGKARDLISDNDSLEDIINKLKNNIKGEPSQSVIAKLQTLKQKSKSPTEFANEVEQLSLKLKRAYISEGVPVNVAEMYTTDQTVKSLSVNTNSERVKIIMQAGTFATSQDAITKFLNVNTNEPQANSVLYTHQNFRTFNNNRSRGRNNYGRQHSRNNNNNFANNNNNNTGARFHQSRNFRGNSNNRYPRGGNRGYRNHGWVRTFSTEQENEMVSPSGPAESH